MTYHNYISLYLFCIFVFYLFLEIESFIPAGRLAHSSILVGNKLYFFGGAVSGVTNEVFYLDVSQPFNIASPPWNDLTANEGMPFKSSFGTVSLSNANNEQSIYFFGGITVDITTNQDSFKSLVYKLDLKSGRWEIPIVKGNVPERRREISAINDNSGKIHIFGGCNFDLGSPPPPLTFFNDMVIFNINELSWSISNQFGAPTPRASYTATLLSNGVIVYIGGFRAQVEDISQINLYDTNSLTWSAKTANLIGQIESRHSHTAVLASNNQIIIHGGSKIIEDNLYAQVTPDIAVLNIDTFEWTIPSISSNIGIVPSLKSHTANLVGNYMIVAYGNITQPNAQPLPSKNANIYIMDIRNYTWVNTFEPTSSANNSSTPSSTTSAKPTNTSENQSDVNNQLTTMKIVTGTISGVVGTAVLILIGILGHKRYQRYQRERQNEIIRIHGNNTRSLVG